MPLPVAALSAVGVQFIAENADDFLDIFNKVAGNVAIATEQVERFTGSLAPVGSSTKEVEKAIDEATISVGEFDWVMHTISNTIANLIANGIMALSNAIAGIPQQAYAATAALQDMEITLQTLVAGDFLASGATDEMSDAIARSVPVVEGLMDKLEELSVASPFQYQQILSVFQMNKSFGMATEMAFETTRAITNLAATMKGVPNITSRLSYNFSQMALIGKITARDMRDLRMAGLDLEKVFQKQLGMTVKEVNKELATGAMVFEDVSKAFVSYVDKYIGPAAMRASRTLGGLKSTLGDIAFFAYGNMFKKAGDEIAAGLGIILDSVLNVLRSETFKEIGVVFAVWTKGISDFAVTMFQPLIDTTENFDDYMAGKAQAMFDWGLNIAESLANGIIAGMNYLTSAMVAIGNLLANWLMPGSPPKVAPDIDKWGLDTAREWLKGFTDADYSILDSIQRPLQQTLSTLMSMGMLGVGEDQELFADLSKSIMKALEGQMSFDSVIGQIASKTGPFSQDMAKLVGLQFDYYKATEAATKAQEDLIAAQEKEQDATNKVYSSVKEYNDLLRKGADKKTLRAKLEQINANRKEQVAARQSTMAVGEQYVAAQQGLGTIQEQISTQQKLLDTLLELAGAYSSAQQAQEAAAASGRAAAAMGGTAQTPRLPAVAIPFSESEMSKKMNDFKERLLKQMSELRDGVTERFKQTKDNMLAVWRPLAQKIITIWDAVKTILTGEELMPFHISNIAYLFGIDDSAVSVFLGKIQSLKDVVTGVFAGTEIEQGDIINVAAMFGVEPDTVNNIVTTIETVRTKAIEIFNGLKAFLTPIFNAIQQAFVILGATLLSVIQTLAPQFGLLFKTAEDGQIPFEELGKVIGQLILDFAKMVSRIIMHVGAIISIWMALTSALDAAAYAIGMIFETVKSTIFAVTNTIVLIVAGFMRTVSYLFEFLGKTILAILRGDFSAIRGYFLDFAGKTRQLWQAIIDKIVGIWEGLKKKILSMADTLRELVIKAGKQLGLMLTYWTNLREKIIENVNKINGIIESIKGVVKGVRDFIAGIKWPEIKIPLPDIGGGIQGITDFLEGLGGQDITIDVNAPTDMAEFDFGGLFGGGGILTPPIDTTDIEALDAYLSTDALSNYVSSVQDAWSATNTLSSSMGAVGGNVSIFDTAMAQGALAIDGLATEAVETQASLETYSDSQIKYGKNLMSSLDGMIYKYDELQIKMEDWLKNTAADVVNMLGTKFAESSEQYQKALIKVDEVLGTNYTKQLETKTALQELMDTYAETGDVEAFGEGLRKLKEEEMASMEQGLQDVTEKAGLLYDALLSLPAKLQVEIGFDVGAIPQWLINYMQTGRVTSSGNAQATYPPRNTTTTTSTEEDKPQLRAGGGAVHKNKPYVVGEEGPEWFIPPNTGKILRTELPLPSKYFDFPMSQSVTNSVTIEFGTVTISNSQEGAVFEQRVERAVRKALGA